MDVVVIGARP